MKTLVLSYSLTGNNATVAKGVADILGADFETLREQKKRNVFTIVLDVIFGRIPKIHATDNCIENYENLVFVAPIWLGKVASPFRAIFKTLKGTIKNYSFVSLSAGADGPNPNLEIELTKQLGVKPAMVINPLITDILPKNPKPSRKDLDAYRIKGSEASELIHKVVNELVPAMNI